MDNVRHAINEIRSAWDRYPQFMEELRQFMDAVPVGAIGAEDLARKEALYSSTKTWADQPGGNDNEYSAIRLYSSEIGYHQIFSVINAVLRSDHFVGDARGMRAATFIVELLNIDLFNYRARHAHADNFEGTVYRGMCVSAEDLELFNRVACGPIAERYISIPLSMASSSTDPGYAMSFALEQTARNPGSHPLLWKITVRSLDSKGSYFNYSLSCSDSSSDFLTV
jgi:hypothetical protein